MSIPSHRDFLVDIFGAAISAVEPGAALDRALDGCPSPAQPPAILSMGKASVAMAEAAGRWLDQCGAASSDGLIVGHQTFGKQIPGFRMMQGDHPLPGHRSLAAADAIGRWIASLGPERPVQVLVSGGTSSLIGAPLEPLTLDGMAESFRVLLASGMPIEVMNLVRRRITRWGGGRLAAALGNRPISAWYVSDVPSNDLAMIGSGPLVGTDADGERMADWLASSGSSIPFPPGVAGLLDGSQRPGPPVEHRIIADGLMALNGAAMKARKSFPVTIHDQPATGDATDVGQEIATMLSRSDTASGLHCWRGETTVRLPDDHGYGGRCQQLALAAARVLSGSSCGREITILAAGTDGRDGPTDAAGAIVNRTTWQSIGEGGIDPMLALLGCDSHPALDAVGALLRIGATGTNVADLTLALISD